MGMEVRGGRVAPAGYPIDLSTTTTEIAKMFVSTCRATMNDSEDHNQCVMSVVARPRLQFTVLPAHE